MTVEATAWSGLCLHQIFERRVSERHDAIAVTTGDGHVTYRELDERAGRLADRLRRAGVRPDSLVALYADRGVEMIVGLIGILKAGGAYVPVDPAYPARRVRFQLSDCGASVVVASRAAAADLGSGPVPVLPVDGDDVTGNGAEAREPLAVGDRNLAYAIYTSGTTGTPKAALIEHRSVVRLFERTRSWFQFDRSDVWTMFHSIAFDFSVWEIWGALLHGGRLVVVPAEVIRSPERLRRLLEAERVTVLNQTPSAFRQLVDADAREPSTPGLRLVVLGGERLDVGLLAPWIARHGDQRPALVNMYGITETTVHVTCRRILEVDLRHPDQSPIGVPVPDLRLHLLDGSRRPVPDGEPGDLYVAGPGLARGYLNRPALTAERFVELPEAGRLYWTGDRAVRRPDGELLYLGRSDHQLKVRGFRIEPQEVEACLRDHPLVEAAVVTAEDFGAGDVRLVAHVLARADGDGATRLTDELTARASGELPPHMRPSTYRFVSELPMTPQGKVDREALRAGAVPEDGAVNGARRRPDDVEVAVRGIVLDVLERPEIEAHDDIFDLGATSLALVRIIAIVNQRFGVWLTGAELDDTASVHCLARCVESELAVQCTSSLGE